MQIENDYAMHFLSKVPNNSVDLILTDPPYQISKDSGMDRLYNDVKAHQGTNVKTEEDWEIYKKTLKKPQDEIDNGKGKGWSKENYIKYGHIQGIKYATRTHFGEWDYGFDWESELEPLINEYYKKLKKGGTLIMFFDIWKISYLHRFMENAKFKQIRFIEWVKTNAQPINSKINYLSNCREVALVAVKHGKPTFHSQYDNGLYEMDESYDNGVYKFPMASGKRKIHPTQKNLKLFETIIKKHSNENDIVLDTFLGGGTTAIACKNTNRQFKGCEINKEYYDQFMEFLKDDH